MEYENGEFQHLGSVVTNGGYSDWATTEIPASVGTMWYRLSRREDDYRIFTHSTVAMVAKTVRILTKTRRYAPRPGQSVWLTHMARTLHGTQAELDKALPAPLKAAYDGLEVEFLGNENARATA